MIPQPYNQMDVRIYKLWGGVRKTTTTTTLQTTMIKELENPQLKRNEMLERLKSIEGTIIVNLGHYDTGTEFQVFTALGRGFGYVQGYWPLEGPISYTKEEYEMGKKVAEIDWEEYCYDEEYIQEMFDELGIEPWSNDMIKKINALGEEEYRQFAAMARTGCLPGNDYYSYNDTNEILYFESEEEAFEAFLDDCSGGYTSWNELSKDELEDAIEQMGFVDYQLEFELEMALDDEAGDDSYDDEEEEEEDEVPALPKVPPPPPAPRLDVIAVESETAEFYRWLDDNLSNGQQIETLKKTYAWVLWGNENEIGSLGYGEENSKPSMEAFRKTLSECVQTSNILLQKGFDDYSKHLAKIRLVVDRMDQGQKRVVLLGKVAPRPKYYPEYLLDSTYKPYLYIFLERYKYQVEELEPQGLPVSVSEFYDRLPGYLQQMEIDVICLIINEDGSSYVNLPAFLKEKRPDKYIHVVLCGPNINWELFVDTPITPDPKKNSETLLQIRGFDIF